MREFLMRQSAAKDEVLTANFIYRSEVTQREITNGVHRGTLQLKRGMTTEEVCKLVRLDVAKLGEVFEIPSVAGRSMVRVWLGFGIPSVAGRSMVRTCTAPAPHLHRTTTSSA